MKILPAAPSNCHMRLAFAALLTASSLAHADPTGVVKGTVIFEGEAPERAHLKRDVDPYCAKTDKLAEDIVVTKGKLKDVLVRVKTGGPKPAASPPAAVIDQKECMYTPRVVSLAPGQKIMIKNSDNTFHNVHGTIAGKLAWNKPSSPGDAGLTLDGAKPGDVIDVVCDVHPWMKAYAVVSDTSAVAVTGDDGTFELKGLEPGSYTLEAWHPTLGTKTLDVKIGKGAKGTVTARISYKRNEMP